MIVIVKGGKMWRAKYYIHDMAGNRSHDLYIFHHGCLIWSWWYIVHYLISQHNHMPMVESSRLTTTPYLITVHQLWCYPFFNCGEDHFCNSDKLKKFYGEDEKLKRVKLQTLRNQFVMNQMKEEDSDAKFFSRLVLLTNQMKVCSESINNLKKIEKVLGSLSANLYYIIVSTTESKNLPEIKLEELEVSLEAYEMRLK